MDDRRADVGARVQDVAMDPLAAFTEPTRAWFTDAFAEPTPIQTAAWPVIQGGGNVLAVAPTGSGKTLAAFLSALDACLHPREEAGVRVLYVSPLKALAVDVERNLRSPLTGISARASTLGQDVPAVTVGMRTGDTPAHERRALVRQPPQVLITTPESLFLLLTSNARSMLTDVETVIVDEVHAVAGTKRGAHLAVSLARLDRLVGRGVQRVGLSATVNPLDEAARFLGGGSPVAIVTVPSAKDWHLEVQVPVEDLSQLGSAGAGPAAEPLQSRASIWPSVEARIVDLIRTSRSTIVFANSRRLAERLTARLNEIHAEELTGEPAPSALQGPPAQMMAQAGASTGAPPLLARAHHGSVSKEQRAQIEEDLKTGRLRCVVATSSLELGIDMGAVDLVIQVEAPPSVASGLQRVGRAGHQVGATSRAVVLPSHRSDLLASAVVVGRMNAGALESLRVPANPLDVAAQHVVSCVAMDDWTVSDILSLLRGTAPFASLTPAVLESVLEMLAGRYPSDAFAHLRARIVWDRHTDVLSARPGAQRLAVTSGGTIPDRGLFAVFLVGGGRVGELDEEMVYESRVGDRISLGASTWLITDITHDRVLVVPAPGVPGKLPFWKGDALGRSAELGAAVGAFTRTLAGMSPESAGPWLGEQGLDQWAARNLVAYVSEQLAATGRVPSDRTIVVERTRDELGDWRICVLSPFGARVHAPWALMARERLAERFSVDASVLHGDEGIVARLPELGDDTGLSAVVDCLFPDPDEVADTVTRLVGGSALFASRFRECAARALLLPRQNPTRRMPLWQQRQRSAQLLAIAAEHPDFPIVLETVRECLQDVYDLPALTALMTGVRDRHIRVVEVTPATASPFARSLLFGYVAEFLYEGDSPLAERRAAALTLDPTLLGELLGRADLRDLLDPAAIEQVEATLQHLTAERRARHMEDAADVLRTLGPLSAPAALERGIDLAWLRGLEDQRRVLRTRIRGDEVWAGVEDAARLRDALGAPVPPGIAEAHLRPVPDPVGDVVARFARTHGPFRAADVVAQLGLAPAVVAERLAAARAAGRLVEGQFVAGGSGTQWCHPDVLRMIKRRSVALLRHEMEPVSGAALAQFLAGWQGITGTPRTAPLQGRGAGADAVLDAVRTLAGVPLPASALEASILPLRVPGYTPELLDELTSSGMVLWTGVGALPGGDAWIALAPAEEAFLLPVQPEPELPPAAGAILEVLRTGGGWFFPALMDRVNQASGVTWDRASAIDGMFALLWSSRVSNDTIGPVRAMLSPGAPRRGATATTARHGLGRGRYAGLWRPGSHAAMVMPAGLSPGYPQDSALVPGAGRHAPADHRVQGRWFALPATRPDDGTVALAVATAHLDRLGLVTRGAVAAAGDPGGFAAAYRTLSAMEEVGRAQRVYAVEGLGAAQFAVPGVVDRLRAAQRELDDGGASASVLVLAAADPANAYGAALEWPTSDSHGDPEARSHRPTRSAGAHVVLVAGVPVLYVERGGHSLLSFGLAQAGEPPSGAGSAGEVAARAASALVEHVRARTVPSLMITRINGVPALEARPGSVNGVVAAALRSAGFIDTPRGLRARA